MLAEIARSRGPLITEKEREREREEGRGEKEGEAVFKISFYVRRLGIGSMAGMDAESRTR